MDTQIGFVDRKCSRLIKNWSLGRGSVGKEREEAIVLTYGFKRMG